MNKNHAKQTNARAYICHTYYQIYVTLLKELVVAHGTNTYADETADVSSADLFLSLMSKELHSPDLYKSLVSSGIFRNVFYLNEKKATDFPQLQKYKDPSASIFKKMLNRMAFSKELPKAMSAYIQEDFSVYKDVYVYCDEDPIAYYLNYKKIPFHAVEDGLDCIVNCDVIIKDDSRFLALKQFLAAHGLIFMPNGYSKYAIDMEVNDLSRIKYPHKGWKEIRRDDLVRALTPADKERILQLFVPDLDRLKKACETTKGAFLLLTQPLCDLKTRKRIFEDIIRDYANGAPVIIKPHPRDSLDYQKEFPSCLVLDSNFPIEVLNFCAGVHFHTALSVMTTVLDAISFADKKVNLGWSFLDPYEDPALHTYD